ncbi:acetyl-CoA carboxylase biotin carboxylase subunit [Lutibaculum baratangense]|uniref:Methylcrotonyl-CoA carboxylase biotin-containing subunit n=1 Tax=Lutibaculum baratangense AMV1 TaxID=631454 RepID=V4TI00_9HYPH|nr:biotin carboxylase N-terminal domain-containing protein [Lutibaculum baratangense]ESR25643.1 Methylcrotonyl-CoA carboxylase biotin-containing subunit [Lutibaculum baratangense AMV1]
MKKILVANRGEIARRIFRSCRDLGIATVAVHSEADADAAHVAEANEARLIGPASPRESYLVRDRVLQAARETGAEAIHPGYGFLSENADFAEEAEAAGLVWIGPTPRSIRQMGDKQRARDIAEAAGAPVVPGSRRFEPGELSGLAEAAEEVGFPLLVKASAGGGGIGMRRVDDPAKLEEVVEGTQSMAGKAFGDGAVFLERFVPKARHVEVQVFGFGDGGAVHLFERDCSLQRRFQKVIEESPAPGLAGEVRARMAEAALKLCRATSYRGAGTVEFIVDAETFEFFFLEMNTRIQVEHPVTEMVTGRDLVAMQIELARGTLPTLDQDGILSRGHAVECRLYAENPAKMFMPSPGPLDVLAFPDGMEHVRVDSGYRQGDMVTPHYDPMIAKVIAWGETRDEARARAAEALRATRVEGIRTNLAFLVACLEDEAFAAGDVHTGFIETRRGELLVA